MNPGRKLGNPWDIPHSHQPTVLRKTLHLYSPHIPPVSVHETNTCPGQTQYLPEPKRVVGKETGFFQGFRDSFDFVVILHHQQQSRNV